MISVIVPVYNMGKLLPKCLDSLLGQTYADYEIILVNDGSKDDSGEVCEQQAKRSEKISVVHKANGGLSSARNRGIEEAHGDFIIFPDPDDYVEPDYLEKLLSIREKNGADLSICGFYRSGQKEERPFAITAGVLDAKEALRRLVLTSEYSGYAWNKLFDLRLIREKGLRFDEELTSLQDLHFCFRYFQFCTRIAVDPVPLYHYSISTGVSARTAPLTPRSLRALLAYEKLAKLARESICPELESVMYGQLFDRSLKYLYLYYYNKTHDRVLQRMLKDNLRMYEADFFALGNHSWRYNLLARTALISPRLYYLMLRILQKVFPGI